MQTDRQTDGQTDRQTDRQTHTQRHRDRQTERKTYRQIDRQAERQKGRKAERQTGRQADRQTGTEIILFSKQIETPFQLNLIVFKSKTVQVSHKMQVFYGRQSFYATVTMKIKKSVFSMFS